MPSKVPKRRRNALPSIHDPPDPSPRTLPDAVREEWDEAYEEGLDVYGKKDLARRAAWREITLRWNQTGKQTWKRCSDGVCHWPGGGKAPMPKKPLIDLGVLVEYVFLDRRGRLQVRELDRNHPPLLWWDNGRKMLYAMPNQPYPQECNPIPDSMWESVELYRSWHQRDPQCLLTVGIPDVSVKAIGAADSLSYASDKWNDADPDPAKLEAQEYIHNHWYDVWIWQDTDRTVPNIIIIHGGELDLHPRGLIH